MYYKSRCIILKNRDLRETDKLVTIFSEQEGKIAAVAKGIKKPKSSLRGCIQPFCHSFLFFSRGREMDLITQGQVIDFFGNSREDISRTLHSMYIMELLDKSLMEGVSLPELYTNVLSVLELVNEQGLNSMLIRFLECQLLINLGYKPVLNICCRCGGSNLQNARFNMAEGGLICRSCGLEADAGILIGGETLALLRLLTAGKLHTLTRVKASPQALQGLEVFLERYLEYYLERKFNIKNTIRLLKKSVAVPN